LFRLLVVSIVVVCRILILLLIIILELIEMRVLLLLLRLRCSPIGVINNKIIVLRDVLGQAVVLRAERNQLLAGTVVSKLLWSLIFLLKHSLEEHLTVPSTLNRLVNIEVKNAEWLDFSNSSMVVPVEQISFSYLK